ncbi:efflux transporter outer membrane subunit [Burkholderia sp. 22PA0099]|uniref:efflux transporter outer membrane subunit n=1 Tax=Burkholderia sp. 22PA0099 TaxID=3237372 RepID=UPI0039C19A6D
MMHFKLTKIVLACGVFALSACTMEPKYVRPALPVSATYAQADQMRTTNVSPSDVAWEAYYPNAELRGLIALAIANNRDLRVSVLNIERARAQYRIQRADLLPTLAAQAGGNVARMPSDLSATGQSGVTHDYSVGGAVASYELDLFGRVRSLTRQALQAYLATEQARRAVQISLVSEVANAWLTLQADHQLYLLARQTRESQSGTLSMIDSGYRAGTSTALDLNQARSQVRSAQAAVARYDRQIKLDHNALTLLVGSTIPAEWMTYVPLESIRLDEHLDAGAPSDLLTRRPDIIEAENQLKAANANIGAARAAFFPRIVLTASGGTASASLSGLFDPGSAAWSFGPSISVPIFDFGRNAANLEVSKVQREIEVENYRKAIQLAFREVSDALDGRETFVSQEEAQAGLVAANAESYRLSHERFENGVSSYLDVLVSQRALFQSQQDWVAVRLAREANVVNLYGALGGGWKTGDKTGASAASSRAEVAVHPAAHGD